MERRRLLAACAGALPALAGCAAGPGTDAGSPGDESGTEPPTADASLTVTAESLLPGVAVTRIDDVVVRDRGQYLRLGVEADAESPPARSEFAFRFDGSRYRPLDPDDVGGRTLTRAAPDDSGAYADGSGWVCFELPESGDASDAALLWNGESWTPNGLPTDRLASPDPPLSVAWSAPESVTYTPGAETAATVDLTATVVNEGDEEAVFVAAVNRLGFVAQHVDVLREPVAAGATAEVTLTETFGRLEAPDGENPQARFVCHWPGERAETTVELRPE